MKYYTHFNASIRNTSPENIDAVYDYKSNNCIVGDKFSDDADCWTIECSNVEIYPPSIPQIFFDEDQKVEVHIKDGFSYAFTIPEGVYWLPEDLLYEINKHAHKFKFAMKGLAVSLITEEPMVIIMPPDMYQPFCFFDCVHILGSNLPDTWYPPQTQTMDIGKILDMRSRILVCADIGRTYNESNGQDKKTNVYIGDFDICNLSSTRRRLVSSSPLINNINPTSFKELRLAVYVKYCNGSLVQMNLPPGMDIEIALKFVCHK